MTFLGILAVIILVHGALNGRDKVHKGEME